MGAHIWEVIYLCSVTLVATCSYGFDGHDGHLGNLEKNRTVYFAKLPAAPSSINVSAKSHTEVEVTWETLGDADAMDMIAVYVAGAEEKHCAQSISTGAKASGNCTIGGLLPRIPYKVCARVCLMKMALTRSVGPSYSMSVPLVSTFGGNAIANYVETDEYVCSHAVCDSITLDLEVPSNLKVIWRTNGSIRAEWSRLPNDDSQQSYNYTVCATPSNSSVGPKTCCSATDANACTVEDLIPNTAYNLTIYVCSIREPILCSRESSAQTNFTKPGIPLDLRVVDKSSNIIMITWSDPSPNTENITKYDINVTDNQGTRKLFSDTGFIERSLTFNANQICHSVSFIVRACTRNLDCGAWAHLNASTTPPPLINFERSKLTTYTVTLKWKTGPTENCSNTEVAIEVRQPNQTIGYPCVVNTMNRDGLHWCKVEKLSADTEYIASASVCSDEIFGCNNATRSITFWTNPAPPNGIHISEVGSTSIKVCWTAGSGKGANGYAVRVDPSSNASTSSVKSCITSSTEKSCTIGDLEPATEYSVTVSSIGQKNGSERILGDSSESIVITTLADTRLMKILLGIFIPLIVIILLVLLFVFRKRIPCLRDLFSKKSPGTNADLTLFPIKYNAALGSNSLSNIPPPIPIEKFAANLQELTDKQGFQALSQTLTFLTVSEVEEKYRLTKLAALQSESRNRYSNTVPYDQALVLVGRPWFTVLRDQEPRITVNEVEEGYINASYIRRAEYGRRGEAIVSSFTTLPEYIATQGPLESTVADFLTMVYEQRCPLIIMLGECKEGGKENCAQYWPDGEAQIFKSDNCSIEVRKESEELSGSVMRRQLKINLSNETSPWTVTQFQFADWADHGVPDMESFYTLVIIANNFVATHHVGNEYGPTIVHCSDGAGRTGTFMVACFLLDHLQKNPQNVDIVGTVLAARKWRTNLVQDWWQLQFLYSFVDFCIARENLGTCSATFVTSPLPSVAVTRYQDLVAHSRPDTVEATTYDEPLAHPQWDVEQDFNCSGLVENPQLFAIAPVPHLRPPNQL